MSKTIQAHYEELKNTYKVFNLMNKYKEIAFILESPHIDELKNGTPVAGLSGKAMSKVLFDGDTTPIGIKLKGMPEHRIGILNICNVPMQHTAYEEEEVVATYGKLQAEGQEVFFEALEKIRTSPKKTYKDAVKNELQGSILEDFRKEMNKLKDRELLLIPCGKTAEAFFALAEVNSPKWTVLEGVPHPSFGNI